MQSNGAEGVHRLKGMKTCPSSRIFILRYFLVTRLRVVYTAIPLFLPWMRLLEHVDRPLRMIFSMNTPLHSRLRATPRNFDRFSHLFSPFFPFFLFFLLNVICNYSPIQIWVEKRVHYEIFALFFLHQGMLKLLLQIEIRDKIKKLRGT